jgi:hypothetical protein
MVSDQDMRRAALAGNRAIKELTLSFELMGLGRAIGNPKAARLINDARIDVESALEALMPREGPG